MSAYMRIDLQTYVLTHRLSYVHNCMMGRYSVLTMFAELRTISHVIRAEPDQDIGSTNTTKAAITNVNNMGYQLCRFLNQLANTT